MKLINLPLMSDCLIVLQQETIVLPLVRILVPVNAPVRPVVVLLRQEPHDLLPVLAVSSTPELSHPVGS